MNEWWSSKRLLVVLFGVVATSRWDGYMPMPDAVACTWLCGLYVGGQSLVDAAKAWRKVS